MSRDISTIIVQLFLLKKLLNTKMGIWRKFALDYPWVEPIFSTNQAQGSNEEAVGQYQGTTEGSSSAISLYTDS